MIENSLEPNWKEAPTRYYFWAVNESGDAYWYSQEPTYNGRVWINESKDLRVFDRHIVNYQPENAKYSLRKNPNTPKCSKFKVGDLVRVDDSDEIKVVSVANVFGYLDVGVRALTPKYSPSNMHPSERVELVKSVDYRFNFNIGDKVYVFGSNEIHSIIAITPIHYALLNNRPDPINMELLTLADDNSYTTLSKLFENIVFSPPE